MRYLICVLCWVCVVTFVWASESGPLVMDMAERKTVQYSNVDAINSAINADAVSNMV